MKYLGHAVNGLINEQKYKTYLSAEDYYKYHSEFSSLINLVGVSNTLHNNLIRYFDGMADYEIYRQ